MKRIIIIVVVAIILVTTTVFVTKYVTEKNNNNSATIGKADIEIVNDTLKKVIDAYVSELQLKRKQYVITVEVQKVRDTFNIILSSSLWGMQQIYTSPPSTFASYDNKYLLIYTGFEQEYSFSDKYKDDIARLCFPDQFEIYKREGEIPYVQLIESTSWYIRIRDNKIIMLEKFSYKQLFLEYF